MKKVVETMVVDFNYADNELVKEVINATERFNASFNDIIQADLMVQIRAFTELSVEELVALGEAELAEVLYGDGLDCDEINEIRHNVFKIYYDKERSKYSHSMNDDCNVIGYNKYPKCPKCSWEQGLGMGTYDNSDIEIALLKNTEGYEFVGILIEKVQAALDIIQ